MYANIRQHISISLHYTHRCKYESIFSDVFLGVVLLAFAGMFGSSSLCDTQVKYTLSAFNGLRVWAIWGRHWLPLLVVLPFALVPFCMNLVSVSDIYAILVKMTRGIKYLFTHRYVVGSTFRPLPLGFCDLSQVTFSAEFSRMYVSKCFPRQLKDSHIGYRGTDFLFVAGSEYAVVNKYNRSCRHSNHCSCDGCIYFGTDMDQDIQYQKSCCRSRA